MYNEIELAVSTLIDLLQGLHSTEGIERVDRQTRVEKYKTYGP